MVEPQPDFETYDHTADIGLVARGATLEALFINAARGMMHLLAGDVQVRPTRRLDVEVTAGDREALLVAWLNELLFHVATRRLVFGEFHVRELTDERLRATVAGQPIDELTVPLEIELKAATYHGLRVEQTAVGWEAEVLFDV
jgi:SHS2 domain-containing protein